MQGAATHLEAEPFTAFIGAVRHGLLIATPRDAVASVAHTAGVDQRLTGAELFEQRLDRGRQGLTRQVAVRVVAVIEAHGEPAMRSPQRRRAPGGAATYDDEVGVAATFHEVPLGEMSIVWPSV